MNLSVSQKLKAFNDLHGEIGGVFHDAAVDAGISDSVQTILYTILACGEDCTQADISRCTGTSRQTIHSAVRLLQQQGLLQETEGRRNQVLRLTPAGEAFALRTVGPILQAEKQVFAAWPAEDCQALLTLTRRYLTDLQKYYHKESL